MTKLIAAAIVAFILIPATAQARYHYYRHHYQKNRLIQTDRLPHVASSGNVVSHKTGAHATVGAAYAAKFQAYIDELESNGAIIRFMGGIRRGHCSSGSMHPCGRALDVCQLGRGHVDSRCHLPNRTAIAAIAERHGLFEGGQWCSSDYGHAQVGVTAAACGERTLAARSRVHYASRHRYRVATVQYVPADRFGAQQ